MPLKSDSSVARNLIRLFPLSLENIRSHPSQHEIRSGSDKTYFWLCLTDSHLLLLKWKHKFMNFSAGLFRPGQRKSICIRNAVLNICIRFCLGAKNPTALRPFAEIYKQSEWIFVLKYHYYPVYKKIQEIERDCKLTVLRWREGCCHVLWVSWKSAVLLCCHHVAVRMRTQRRGLVARMWCYRNIKATKHVFELILYTAVKFLNLIG